MARGEYPSDKQDQNMVRFPDGMRDQLKLAAETNKRSMNAEIVARLELSLALPPMDLPADLIERMRRTDPQLRQGRGRLLAQEIADMFPAPLPRRVVSISTSQVIESLSRSSNPEVLELVDRIRGKIASGEIDGAAPAEFTLTPVDLNTPLAGLDRTAHTPAEEPADGPKRKTDTKAARSRK